MGFFLAFIGYFSLGVAVITMYLGIKGSSKWYWIAGLGIYLFSFIAGFSIGYYTVAFTFALWIYAAILSSGLIKRHSWYSSALLGAVSIIIGIIIWYMLNYYGLHKWIFYPFTIVFRILG
jgi:hypothetical protein